MQEIIDALKKAQKEQDDKKKPCSRAVRRAAQAPPLIDMLAELKMIRALQMRVNSRTERYSKLDRRRAGREGRPVEALQRLAEQQERIHRVTRDLELGKNQ